MHQEARLHIPTPCHEDWEQMTPQDQGRHCAVCDKVVRDFTGMEAPAIIDEVRNANGKLCGRVNQSVLSQPSLPAQIWVKQPMQGIRPFLLAFIAAFGWQVWGALPAQAQSALPQKIEWTSAAKPDSTRGHIKGIVIDTYSKEPIPGVRIVARRNGIDGDGAISNEDGQFELVLSPEFLKDGPYDIAIHYAGQYRVEHGITDSVANIAITVDLSCLLPDVAITGINRRIINGGIAVGQLVGNYMSPTVFQPGPLYRPLEEWLFMNHSEIIHSGRH